MLTFSGPVVEMKEAMEREYMGWEALCKCERMSPEGPSAPQSSILGAMPGSRWFREGEKSPRQRKLPKPSGATSSANSRDNKEAQDGVRGLAGSTSPTEAKLGNHGTHRNILEHTSRGSTVLKCQGALFLTHKLPPESIPES